MIQHNFNSETNRGATCNCLPGLGEYTVMLSIKQSRDFINHPTRYMWDGSELAEWPGWEAEEEIEIAERELTQRRASTKCGPLQLRRALRATGLMTAVKTYMDTAPEEVVEAWEYATEIYRMDPMVLGLQTLLGKTDEEADELFQLALTFK